MAFSDYGSVSSSRPDRPLVVKCTFDRSLKRVTFNSARNCSYDFLRKRLEQCFSLSATSFSITYKDDDGEITDISSDDDLTEAVQYFQAGVDELPLSSAASIISGRSSITSRKITLRVTVVVDYDGPSLSDTASLASMEEYAKRNGSQDSLSLDGGSSIGRDYSIAGSSEMDDDAVTVSSRDTQSRSARSSAPRRPIPLPPRPPTIPEDDATSPLSSTEHNFSGLPPVIVVSGKESREYLMAYKDSDTISLSSTEGSIHPSAVFERLKKAESANPLVPSPLQGSDRGAEWLREQNSRTIRSLVGRPEPSESDETASSAALTDYNPEDIHGDLALQQDMRGKYYYTYTGSHAGTEEFASPVAVEDSRSPFADSRPLILQPWLDRAGEERAQSAPAASSSRTPYVDPQTADIHPDIPPEVLRFIPGALDSAVPPPPEVTHCSECDIPLDQFRYVCSTCGPRRPHDPNQLHPSSSPPLSAKGKGKEVARNGYGYSMNDGDNFVHPSPFVYPPPPQPESPGSSPASSTWTLMTANPRNKAKPLPLVPIRPTGTNVPRPRLSPFSDSHRIGVGGTSPYSQPSPGSASGSGSGSGTLIGAQHTSQDLVRIATNGYELCVTCIELAGVIHALEGGLAGLGSPGLGGLGSPTFPGTPLFNGMPPTSPDEERAAMSQLRRSAPKQKGSLRHAFTEKVWGASGWKDVEQDDICLCSICSTTLTTKRYKCASCTKFDLCRSCYSQVHEIHPAHAFLAIPDKPVRVRSEPSRSVPLMTLDDHTNGEKSLIHEGVNCTHCLQPIVGARFHCAICPSVDICANCESAGLPGNLTSPDGGHDSSHIMIKIPYPLNHNEVQTASRRAIDLWTGRDAPGVSQPSTQGDTRPRAGSHSSSHAPTVIGRAAPNGHAGNSSVYGYDTHGAMNGRSVSNLSTQMQSIDHRILCRGCSQSIMGVRYQCANCPSSPSSYSLCANCEKRSYVLHEPMHAFIKIPRPVDRPIVSDAPLLPILYKYPAGRIPDSESLPLDSDPGAYLRQLLHTLALCDHCMERINGAWFRCAYCAKDLCDVCESMDAHDSTHVFVVFKSGIDMAKFRSHFTIDLDNPSLSPPVLGHAIYNAES